MRYPKESVLDKIRLLIRARTAVGCGVRTISFALLDPLANAPKFPLAFSRLTSTFTVSLSLIAILLLPAGNGWATLIGNSVMTAAVITQFVSPQIIVNAGVEFSGGSFTPNAGGLPLPTQLINCFGISNRDSGTGCIFPDRDRVSGNHNGARQEQVAPL